MSYFVVFRRPSCFFRKLHSGSPLVNSWRNSWPLTRRHAQTACDGTPMTRAAREIASVSILSSSMHCMNACYRRRRGYTSRFYFPFHLVRRQVAALSSEHADMKLSPIMLVIVAEARATGRINTTQVRIQQTPDTSSYKTYHRKQWSSYKDFLKKIATTEQPIDATPSSYKTR